MITFTGSLSATSFVSESLPGNPTKNVAVGANSSVTIDGDLVFAGTGNEYICNTVAAGGRFVVTGDIVATPDKGVYLRPSVTTSIAGVIAAKGLVNNSGKVNCFVLAPASGQVNWEVGENGISGGSDFMVSNYRSETATATINAATNFTIAAAITNNRLLVLNTSNTVGEPCTITIGNGLAGLISGVGGVQTLGSGTVLFNSVSTFGNELGLYGTSTVAVNSGCRPGNGVVHANTGTAFEIAKSGTVTLNGTLTLDSETTLAFNFTERTNPPVLALASGKSVVFTEGASTNIVVKVSGDVWPTGGEKVLTTCGGFNAEIVSLAAGAPKWASGLAVNGDGNIVLSVKPKPMVIVVR